MSNPIIARFLNNPLQFIPGKVKEPSSAPGSFDKFIVLSKSQSHKPETVVDHVAESKNSPVQMRKPKSMAEAVAAYTGKKFLSKREKRKLQVIEKPSLLSVEDEDLGQELSLTDDSSDESDPETSSTSADSRSQTPQTELSATLQPQVQSSESAVSSSNEESKSSTSTPVASSLAQSEESSVDADFDSNDESESSSSDQDEESEDNDQQTNDSEDLEQLKQDLKQDRIEHEQQDQEDGNESSESDTPPTSPEDDDSKQFVSLSEFHNINDHYHDRGTRPNSKIYKNWRELMNSTPPIGLLNHGVTCYMNSAIQSIIHIPAMQHYLNDINRGKYNSVLKPRSVSHTLAELSKRMWESNNEKGGKKIRYINPKKIIQRLDDINCMMSEWQQEDSHEYFMSLMSRLQEDSTPKGTKLNQSIIYDIFGGLLLQKITCMNCKNVSETNQEFYDLSLGFNKKRHNQIEALVDSSNNTPPPTPGKYTIEKSIKDYFSNELIKLDKNDSQSGYTCENCHKKTIANKISYINEAPETLTIHLKRFKFNGNSSSKVKQSISYSNYLDLTKYTIDGTPTKYRLVSVIVHEGRSLSSGHYIAHCLQPDGSWCTYDDEYINKIPEQQALSDPAAYVLIYTKLTPKALSTNNKRSIDDVLQDKKKRKTT